MKKNDIVKLKIIDMNNDGLGVAKIDDIVFFVKNGLYGDLVLATITKITKNIVYAKATEVLELSKYRNEKKCKVSNSCGGCQIIDLEYKKQIELKTNFVKNNLIKLAGITKEYLDKIFEGALLIDEPFYYRNKVQIPLALKNEKLIYGFFAKRTHYIIENEGCFLSFAKSDDIINIICSSIIDVSKKLNMKMEDLIYDEKEHQGKLRQILLRKSNYTKDLSITLVSNETNYRKNEHVYSEIKNSILEKIKRVDDIVLKTITLNINNEKNNVILGKENIILYGDGYIEDELLGVKFHISPVSFYQVNNKMTKKLYETVVEFLDANGKETLLDLYCGIGTISCIVSKHVKKVFGIEIVKEAIDNANENVKINNINNVEFHVADIDGFLSLKEKNNDRDDLFFNNIQNEKVEIVIVDPPRKGLTVNTIEFIKKIAPKKIIYVSCDSATLSRDLKEFMRNKDYQVSKIKIVDMFPNTMHVETVVLMTRGEGQ